MTLATPLLIGHRGAKACAPENTLCSLRRALADEAHGLEFDIRCTSDGVPVLLHDATLDRTTDASGPLLERTRDSLEAIDAGSSFSAAFEGERIPALTDVLAEFLGRTFLALELKEVLSRDAFSVVKTAISKQPDAPAICASFRAEALAAAKDALPGLSRFLILRKGAELPAEALQRALALSGVFLRFEDASEASIHTIRAAGLSWFAYTVNEPAEAKRLLALAPEGVISDNPRLLRPLFH